MSIMSIDLLQMMFNAAAFMTIMLGGGGGGGGRVKSRVQLTCRKIFEKKSCRK